MPPALFTYTMTIINNIILKLLLNEVLAYSVCEADNTQTVSPAKG